MGSVQCRKPFRKVYNIKEDGTPLQTLRRDENVGMDEVSTPDKPKFQNKGSGWALSGSVAAAQAITPVTRRPLLLLHKNNAPSRPDRIFSPFMVIFGYYGQVGSAISGLRLLVSSNLSLYTKFSHHFLATSRAWPNIVLGGQYKTA
ncbi:hypothetical protein K438DRAFT_1771569 [Mycena galopus ATCC 62051]|nr:hypothetical protein K438DRAFT_1771569 [Mycena galopus ATCC 62051]